MVVPASTHVSGTLLQALFALPLLFGLGLLVDPERTLLLRTEIGVSSVARSDLDVRRWRLRGGAFAAVGVALLYVTVL